MRNNDLCRRLNGILCMVIWPAQGRVGVSRDVWGRGGGDFWCFSLKGHNMQHCGHLGHNLSN